MVAAIVSACGGETDQGDAAMGRTTITTTAKQPTTTVAKLGTGDGTFTVQTETFVDSSRPTGATPGRSLPTDIYLPGGTGPFPLIVLNHGLGGSSTKFSDLAGSWAKAGYVVVAPNFPLTNSTVPQPQRVVADVTNQPGDVSFVVSQVLDRAKAGKRLAGKIATDHMGVAGHSLGGATTYPLAFNSCCRDARFRSAVLMDALQIDVPGGVWDWTRRFPVLVFAGTGDLTIRYDGQQKIIAQLPGPTWSVTLDGGQHSAPFENTPSPHDAVVTATTLDFWAATLRDDTAAAARIATDATVPGVSSVAVTP